MSKKETKKAVKPSQSGVRRGQQEESKLPKILTAVGSGILIALVLALIIALIVTSVLSKKDSVHPFADLPHVDYEGVHSVVVDQQIAALNESASTRDAYEQLIKNKSFIIFYRQEDLKNKQFVEAVLSYFDEDNKNEGDIGIVLYNITLDETILEENDPILTAASEFSDPKLLPFVIVVTDAGTTFDFIGEMNGVLHLLEK